MSTLNRRQMLQASAAGLLAPALWQPRPAQAQDAGPYQGAKLVAGEPPLPKPGSFTVAVLPDTQKYSDRFPEYFKAQTAWLAEQRQRRNIACVLHLGDITDHNLPREWENAQAALTQLDGQLPYFLTLGNHDYGENGRCQDRTTHFNEYFPLAKYRELPTFGGVFSDEPDRLENSYHLFSAGDRDFVVISLEFGPRKEVVQWANTIAAKHKDRAAILITHAYMYYDDRRYDWKKYGPEQKWNPHSYPVAKATSDNVNDGEELWQNLVSKHENFVLTLNGHVLDDGLARLTSATPGGRNVEQVLVNYQMKPNGGDGWLRLLEFRPDGRTVQVYDYSPTLRERNEAPSNQFTMKLSPPKV